jgi:plasmid maintenance system antidote protein VapI
MSERVPAEVFHVMEFVYEELQARGWALEGLAVRMGGDPSRFLLALEFLDLREPDMLIGDEVAAGLAQAFGTSKSLWLKLDETWRKHQKVLG